MLKFFKSGKFSFILGLLLISVLFVVSGTMMLTSSELMMISADIVFSVVLIVFGAYLVINFLFYSKSSNYLSLGLTMILVGCLVKRIPGLFSAFAPALWSFAIIFAGFNLLRASIDLRRAAFKKWWLVLIFAMLTVILGILCIFDPVGIAIANTQLIGISLLADAAFNIAVAIFAFIFVPSDDFLRAANQTSDVTVESKSKKDAVIAEAPAIDASAAEKE